MNVEVKVPEVGESVQEVLLAQWYKRDGDPVETGQILFIIETDKVTLEVASPARGVLRILVPEGTKVTAGKVVATIDSEAAPAALDEKPAPKREPDEVRSKAPEPVPAEAHEPAEATVSDGVAEAGQQPTPAEEAEPRPVIVPPSVRRLAAEKSIDIAKVAGSGPGGRITQGDVLAYWEKSAAGPAAGPAPDRQEPERQEPERQEPERQEPERQEPERQEPEPAASVPEERIDEAPRPAAGRLEEKDHTEVGKVRETPPDGGDQGEATTRKPMSPIRKRIAERLLQARQGTAMVTTFNEIDMSRVQAVRAELKESFKAQYGVSLGIMSFFIKAAVEALKEYPAVNASIDANEIVYHHYHHIGVAVGGERGLVVPVVRHADRLSFAGIESAIAGFVEKIRENRLELSDLEGGTFTVSNGGIYGSLLSTPILNIPQSAILGMHKIEDRPVAVNGQVVVRPMMYVALSYDHRIIDGREAVSFLKRIKECVENPERIMLEI